MDDERIARDGLNEFIKEFDFLENVGSFSNAHLALDKVKKEPVDLIFLDIQMPLMSGLDFATLISDKQCMIVFTTAYSEYALKGYKVNAIDYLLKPIFYEDFKKAVFKAKNLFERVYEKENTIKPLFFKENGIHVKIHPHQIVYVQALQNYVEIYLENKRKIVIHETLKNISSLLSNECFIQIHKSYIVNEKFVTSIDGSILYLSSIEVPIARSRKSHVVDFLLNKK